MSKRPGKGILRAAIGMGMVIGGFTLAGFCFFFWGWPLLDRTEFEHAAWLRGDVRDRGRMVEDLVDRKLLDGKSMEEVMDFLGSPDAVRDDGMIEYTVDTGTKFWFETWYHRLSIRPDDSGRVKGYQVETLEAAKHD